MPVSIHNPDQYMAALRMIVAQGRKRIGILIGAGASAGMAKSDGTYPLIPAVEGLTKLVLEALEPTYSVQIAALLKELPKTDIETVLSRVRALSKVIGSAKVHDLDGPGYEKFGIAICEKIGQVVNVPLPVGQSAYSHIVSWITGTARDHAVEIFTSNYDLLMEEALERAHAPYFDGFTGGRKPFFDPVSIASNDLPARWTRLWKIHGSLGWCTGEKDEVIRTGGSEASHLVFPEHLKYDQTQKAPYSALLDRLKNFLSTPDTVLLTTGFSFADAHIAARIDEGLAGNPSASVFAFQFKNLDEEPAATAMGLRLPNFSVYARDKAIINGVIGNWRIPAEMPNKDWGPIRASYWCQANPSEFTLGAIEDLARFLASSRTAQAFAPSLSSATTDEGVVPTVGADGNLAAAE